MCGSHYMKQYRHGDPYWTKPPAYVDRVGQRFGNLTVSRREGVRWVCLCDCGAETTVNTADLTRGRIYTCGDARIHWRTTTPDYFNVHHWLSIDRGPARRHPCVDCGNRATSWSYDNADPDELIDYTVSTSGRGIRYSANINHYEPRCGTCHKQFDMADRIKRGEPVHKRNPGAAAFSGNVQTP